MIRNLVSMWQGALLALVCGGCSWCRNDLLAETVRPNGEVKAVVFVRDCGGAVASAWGPEVSLLGREQKLDEQETGGNLFAARFPRGVQFGDTVVTIEWRSDSALVLRHDPRLEIRLAVLRMGDVTIEYAPWR